MTTATKKRRGEPLCHVRRRLKTAGSGRLQRLFQVRDQVVDVLDAH